MACVQGLRRLHLGLCDALVGYRLTSVIEGMCRPPVLQADAMLASKLAVA